MFIREFFAIGTIITVKLSGKAAEETALKIENEIRALQSKMNFFNDNSEVSLINSNAGKRFVPISQDTINVLNESKIMNKNLNGYFDITIAPIVKLWSIFSDNEKIPKDSEIEAALSLVNSDEIIINENEVKLNKQGMKIDLGGIAKGYAADKAIKICKENNIERGIINLGGNVSVYNSSENDYFTVGIQNPLLERNKIIGAINTNNQSVVTSGNYVRFFQKDDKKYGHIISPISGRPIENDLLSVTVVGKNSMKADAIATGAYLAGSKVGMDLVIKNNYEGLFISKQNEILITEGLKDNFFFIE